MTKSAFVQGENHLNTRDIRNLLENGNQIDVLYIEDRTNKDIISFWPIDYPLFLTGAFTVYVGYMIWSFVLRLVNRDFNIEKEAHERGIDTYTNIDLELPEIHRQVSTLGRGSSLVITVLVALVSLLLLFQISMVYTIIGTIGLISVPFVYFGVIITEALPEEIRDQSMGDAIIQHAEENGHNNVLILVGDRHVEGVTSHLEKEGWDVTPEKSNDSMMRISRELRSLLSS
jgi:hypothetical protein